MTNAELAEAVKADGDETRKLLKSEMDSLFQIAFAFRYGETSAEAWERFLNEES